MDVYQQITKPTLILDEGRVRRNIAMMAEKAARQGIVFRPHFKTHQSAEIGLWFREQGVRAITVSSVEMALYFASHGWEDILIAFPVNVREMESLRWLARQVRLGLLVESVETVEALAAGLQDEVDIWIKVDVGNGRTGIPWQRLDQFQAVIAAIGASRLLRLRGLLTHAGHTYNANGAEEVCWVYHQSVERMIVLRERLSETAGAALEISVGDTPGCTLCSDLGGVDEIRPGNFVFFDGQQLRAGVCQPEDIAVVVACPVVSRHPERNEVVVYGGAVHISKDTLALGDRRVFGLVTFPLAEGWSQPIPNAAMVRMSQEHGVVELPAELIERVQVGDLLCIIPAHVCLTVSCLGRYIMLDGGEILTLNSSGTQG